LYGCPSTSIDIPVLKSFDDTCAALITRPNRLPWNCDRSEFNAMKYHESRLCISKYRHNPIGIYHQYLKRPSRHPEGCSGQKCALA
jgi:hypothetical protein